MEISHFVAYFHIFIYFPQQKSEFSSKIQAMLRSQRSLRLGIRWLVVSGLGLHTLYPIPCTIIIHNLYISNCYQHGQKCGPGVRLVPSNETQFFAIKLTDLLGKPNGQPPLSPVSNVLTRPHVLHWNLLAVWGLSASLEFYQIYHIHQDLSHYLSCVYFTVFHLAPANMLLWANGSNICFGLVGIGHHLELRVILILHPKKTCLADETVHSTEKDVGKP